MMSRTAVVISVEKLDDEGAKVREVKCDVGGGDVLTADLASPPGEDSEPLPGDAVALAEGSGAGELVAVGVLDTANELKAAGGEVRRYARDESGAPVAEIWIKATGDIAITAIKSGANIEISTVESGGKVTINGVEIDADGNITTPGNVAASGEVTAKADGGSAVNLSTHLHPTGVGPTGAPTPGT